MQTQKSVYGRIKIDNGYPLYCLCNKQYNPPLSAESEVSRMAKLNRKQLLRYVLFVLVLCAARGMREVIIPLQIPITVIWGLLQTSLYVGLIAVWSRSVRRRIIQPQIRVMLEYVNALMIFWHLTKGLKYHIVTWFIGDGWMLRYLWYLYYLPLLLIPALLIMIAFTIRKPEGYRLPKKAVSALFSVSTVLFLCVITNDLHQLVFDFPADAVIFTDKDYSRSILYYFCFAWIVGASLTFFGTTLKNCRLPSKRFLWLPVVPIAACVLYSTAYIFFNDIRPSWDFTTMFTFSLIAIFEIAILMGLIPSNNHYESLFRASEISAIITDEALHPIFTSNAAVIPEKELMQKAVKNGSVTENEIRVSAHPIGVGYVFWQEDVSELSQILAKLEDLNAELDGQYLVLQEAYDTRYKKQSLVEKNRLYNKMQTQTESKVNKLYILADKLKAETDHTKTKGLITEIAVVSAYLKRRNNLLFISEESNQLYVSELAYCLKESLAKLSLNGAGCDIRFELSGQLRFECITELYDAFEELAEAVLPSVSSLFVIITENRDKVMLRADVQTLSDLNPLAEKGFAVENDEDNEWNVKYTAVKGGDRT